MNGPAFYLSWSYSGVPRNVKQTPQEAADVGLVFDFLNVTQDLSRFAYRMQGEVSNGDSVKVLFSTSFVHWEGGRARWNALPKLSRLALRELNASRAVKGLT